MPARCRRRCGEAQFPSRSSCSSPVPCPRRGSPFCARQCADFSCDSLKPRRSTMNRRSFVIAVAAAALAPSAFAQKPMKIGVIGSGRIGSTLGGLWLKAGHEVMFSDRDPEAVKRAIEGLGPELKPRARAGSVQEAVAFGEAILIAVPYAALPAIQQQVGAQLKGKVVIDPNNPVPSRDGDMAVQAKEKGAAASTAVMLPGARLVRSFNSWGYAVMAREANRPAPRM